MLTKRGQVTVFIIIGIIILVTVVGFLFLKGKLAREEVELREEKIAGSISLGQNVKYYIESCIERVTRESVTHVAEHGGYEYGSNFSIEYNGENRPYYFHLNETFFPELSEVEQAFSSYVEKELIYCVANLYENKEKGYNFIFDSPNVGVRVADNKVNFNIAFNVKVEQGDLEKGFNLFQEAVPTRFGTLYEVARNISLTQLNHPEGIIRSNLIDLAEDHVLKIETITISENDVIYVIKDENEPLEYVMAVKYDW